MPETDSSAGDADSRGGLWLAIRKLFDAEGDRSLRAQLEEAIDDELVRLATERLPQSELRRAKRILESSDAHDEFHYNNDAEYAWYDIADYDSIEHLFKGVDYVFHLAGKGDLVPSVENPTKYIENNVMGTLKVLELSRKLRLKKFQNF